MSDSGSGATGVFTSITGIQLPATVQTDPTTKKNLAFAISVEADGRIPFVQAILRRGDEEYLIKDRFVSMSAPGQYRMDVPKGLFGPGRLYVQVEGCRKDDFMSGGEADWVKHFAAIEVVPVGAASVPFWEMKLPRTTSPCIVEGMPNICGEDASVVKAMSGSGPLYPDVSSLKYDAVDSAFAVALHMHQPTIFGQGELGDAPLICNLQDMYQSASDEQRHNAEIFVWCYSRIADIVRELAGEGRRVRVMLDYSGNLLWGLMLMGRQDVIDNLRDASCRHPQCVEWIGTMFSHALASSTPVPDLKLQMRAWQHFFATLFGWEALARVRGFSPPEMHLPNHPDVLYDYVVALKECGYRWLLMQEHTVEETDGSPLRERYLPRRLVARNSRGEVASITAIIKTQGSDTKLVAQMQPYHEAKGMRWRKLKGKHVPPIVAQIGDGENGGVMMHEFPDGFRQAFRQAGDGGAIGVTGTEYLELLGTQGIGDDDFEPVQALYHHKIFGHSAFESGKPLTKEQFEKVLTDVRSRDPIFHLEGSSWTNNLSWVRGYQNVLDPIRQLSEAFHARYSGGKADTKSGQYRKDLLYLLLSQTSCFRYWGQGRWTDYARELCRRGMEGLKR